MSQLFTFPTEESQHKYTHFRATLKLEGSCEIDLDLNPVNFSERFFFIIAPSQTLVNINGFCLMKFKSIVIF